MGKGKGIRAGGQQGEENEDEGREAAGLCQEEARPLQSEVLSPVGHTRVVALPRRADGMCALDPDLLHDGLREEDVPVGGVLHKEPVLDDLAHHLVVRQTAGQEEGEDEGAVECRRRELVKELRHLVDPIQDLRYACKEEDGRSARQLELRR